MLTKTKILNFLAEHPAIKVTTFLKECDLGRNYLNQKDAEQIPEVTALQIISIMKKYGYEIH